MPRSQPEPHGAVAAMLAAEFEQRELGASGEFVVGQPEPAPTEAVPPLIPPPPWSENYIEEPEPQREAEPEAPDTPRLDEVKAWRAEQPTLPAPESQPLERPAIPAPDWT